MNEYSNKFINDDNFDDEFETMCDMIGVSYGSNVKTYEVLPDDFSRHVAKYKDKSFYEYIRCRCLPNKGSDFKQALNEGEVAFKFANLYMSIGLCEVI